MKVEMEVDLGPLAARWELTGEFRLPVQGVDTWLSPCGKEVRGRLSTGDCADGLRVILRRRWVFPEWVTALWYCEGANGEQYLSASEPMIERNQCASWWALARDSRNVSGVTTLPKIGGDWQKSKRRNPRAA